MIRYLIDLAARKLPLPQVRSASYTPLGDDELTLGLKFLQKAWEFKKLGVTNTIPPVKCPVLFGGCGYVEGRTKGIRINRRITLTEADEDMGFTEYCVLIDNVPAMLIMIRGSGVGVMVLGGQDYFEQFFTENRGWLPCTTLEQFKALPDPVQRLMNDILQHCANQAKKEAPKDIGLEKVLDYWSSKR